VGGFRGTQPRGRLGGFRGAEPPGCGGFLGGYAPQMCVGFQAMYWPLVGGLILMILITLLLGWITDPSRRSDSGRH